MVASEIPPLNIAKINVNSGGGTIGISICPGLKDLSALVNRMHRDLEEDVKTISSWNANAVLTLMEEKELQKFGVENLGEVISRYKIDWYHMPIQDMCTPDKKVEEMWEVIGKALGSIIKSGGKVLIHCRGGLGRSGMVAARMLVELGWTPEVAIQKVRDVRPGAIETREQEKFVTAVSI